MNSLVKAKTSEVQAPEYEASFEKKGVICVGSDHNFYVMLRR